MILVLRNHFTNIDKENIIGLAWLGLAWLGLAWLGLACARSASLDIENHLEERRYKKQTICMN